MNFASNFKLLMDYSEKLMKIDNRVELKLFNDMDLNLIEKQHNVRSCFKSPSLTYR